MGEVEIIKKDMSEDEKDRYIRSLLDKINMFELDKRATELAVEEFQSTFDSVSASLESFKKAMETLKFVLLVVFMDKLRVFFTVPILNIIKLKR